MRKLVWVASGLVTIACTGPGVVDRSEDELELAGTIGAEGGRLEGDPEGAFAGVAVDVPAGALAEPTRIRVRAAFDATPLPELAERVGELFELGPSDARFAAPVEVTLPVDPGLLTRFGGDGSEIRVWRRVESGWERATAVRSTSTSVSIEVEALGVMAAGVVLALGAAPACITAGTCVPALCDAPSGFCPEVVAELGVDAPSPIAAVGDLLVAEGARVYYPVPSGVGLAIVRYRTDTGEVAMSAPLPITRARIRNLRVVAGDVWAGGEGSNGQSIGNLRFRFDGPASEQVDLGSGSNGLGAALLPDGRSTRYTTTGFVDETGLSPTVDGLMRATTLGRRARVSPLPGSNGQHVASRAKSGDPTRFDRLDRFVRTVRPLDGSPVWQSTSVLRLPFESDAVLDGNVSVGPDPSDPEQSHIALVDTEGRLVLCRVRGLVEACDRSPVDVGVAIVAQYDEGGGLWIGRRDVPVLLYRDSDGTTTSVDLAAALPGMPGTSLLPRAIAPVSRAEAVVRVNGPYLVRVTRRL